MLLNRERFGLLILLSLMAIGLSSFLIWRSVKTSQDHFTAGAPPQDIKDVVIPQEIELSKLKPPAIQARDMVRYGSATSVISVIEYGDYECSDCRDLAKTIKKTLEPYGGSVRFVFHQLPIEDRHPNALNAAVFAICAGQQGAFWAAHDALMETTTFNEVTYQIIGRNIGLDAVGLAACRNNPEIAAQIRQQVELAKSDGINGAPLLFVGTQASYGAMTSEELQQAINRYISN